MDLAGLVAKAEQTHSDAVLIVRGGETVLDWATTNDPIELMSVTKMVSTVALGLAVPTGVADFLASPVATWIDEWADDERREITVRQLVTHTSGLEAGNSAGVYASGDIVGHAIATPFLTPPGPFAYNNRAFNLVGELVRRITGTSLLELASDHLFGPLGFGEWGWDTDEIGGVYCMSNLQLTAAGLAKVGQLFLPGGPTVDGLPAEWLAAMPPQSGRELGVGCYVRHAWVRPLADGSKDIGPPVGFGHDGDGGQWLVVLPEFDAVAVRQRRTEDRGDPADMWADMWADFPGDAWAALTG